VEGDLPEPTLSARSDLGAVLASLPLLAGLDPTALQAIAAEVDWLSLPGGAVLFEAGEPSDSLYVVLSGCLGVWRGSATDRRLLGRVVAGDTVGEMGLISGRARSATVVALRDSELARLSRASFDTVIARHPQAMQRIARLMVDRLEALQSGIAGRTRAARTFAIVPHSIEIDAAGFATALVGALGRFGRTELVWSVRGAEHTSLWFHALESANDYVVYVADATPSPWSKLCMRQADALLLLAHSESTVRPWPHLEGTSGAAEPRSEIILLHDGAVAAGVASRWLELQPGVAVHHVRDREDVPRIARLLTGRAVGLVLSGGGARGFAHIGALRALAEAGVPIDLVGGTSMGAIMAAGVAAGWGLEELTLRLRRSFVETNPLHDYTLPVVSLVSGRKVSALLHREFGERRIEDLPLPFFCVSSNLTTGHPSVHRTGMLWRWLRASVAIPGVLPPVLERGEVLVDGGAMNNLPVDCMREIGRGPVVGCDVAADRAFTATSDDLDVPPLWKVMSWLRGGRRRPNIFQILWRAGMVSSTSSAAARRAETDLLLQPPLAAIDMLNWKAFDRAVSAGYEHTLRRLSPLPAPLAAALGRAADAPERRTLPDEALKVEHAP
jgi:NTE family protein